MLRLFFVQKIKLTLDKGRKRQYNLTHIIHIEII